MGSLLICIFTSVLTHTLYITAMKKIAQVEQFTKDMIEDIESIELDIKNEEINMKQLKSFLETMKSNICDVVRIAKGNLDYEIDFVKTKK